MNRPRQFELLVFDWDGTLFDSTTIIVQAIQAACADLGAPVPSDQDAAYVIGLGLGDALRYAVPSLPRQDYPALAERYRHHYFAHEQDIVLFDGVVPMLQALKTRHHWMAIATGKSRAGLDRALQHSPLKGLFDSSRTADETASKPDPRMLNELMRQFGVEPEHTLMIGDTVHDLQLAQNAGVSSVAVSYGAHSPEAFGEFHPRLIAHTVPELHDWLLRHA